MAIVFLHASAIAAPAQEVGFFLECDQPDHSDCIELKGSETLWVRKLPDFILRKDQVLRAVPTKSESETGRQFLSITVNDDAAKEFARITRENLGKRLAIVYQGWLVMAPTIKSEITSGNIQISSPKDRPHLIEELSWLNEGVARKITLEKVTHRRDLLMYLSVGVVALVGSLVYALRGPRRPRAGRPA